MERAAFGWVGLLASVFGESWGGLLRGFVRAWGRFALLLLLLASSQACRTQSRDQIELRERLEDWAERLELAESFSTGASERLASFQQLFVAFREIKKEKSAAFRAAIVRAAPPLYFCGLASPEQREDLRMGLARLALEDENIIVRTEAVEALSRVGGASAVQPLADVLIGADPLTRLLKERSAEVRALAARALGDLNSARAAAALIEAYDKDPVKWVRHQAEISLMRLAGGRAGRSVEEWKDWLLKQGA